MTNPMECFGVYTQYATDMHHITAVKSEMKREREEELKDKTPADKVLCKFGVKDAKGNDIHSGWKISGGRVDKRHGVVDKAEGFSRYADSLLTSMFAGWNNGESSIAG